MLGNANPDGQSRLGALEGALESIEMRAGNTSRMGPLASTREPVKFFDTASLPPDQIPNPPQPRDLPTA
jgi:hypothetical protein